MEPIQRLPPKEARTGRVHVLIDTPAGSRNKYKYDEQLKVFRLSRILPAGAVFPHNFGSIPGTRGADGDPLDVLVLNLPPSFCGCLVTVRLLGVLHARQVDEGRTVENDRLIGTPETEVNKAQVRELKEIGESELRAIEQFFENYNRAHGRTFRVTGRGGRRAAEQVLEKGMRAYEAGG